MDAARGPYPPEVEAKSRHAQALGNLDRPDHHGIVHVAAVQRMGVTDHQAGLGRLGQGQPGLQPSTVPNVNLHRRFHVTTLVR
jgi:hypothetical protein